MENTIDLISSGFHLEQIDPIHQKRLVAFINFYLTSVVNHLNDFALNCEEKLFCVEKKLVQIETAVTLLEAKLASIPGLTSTPVVSTNSQATANLVSSIASPPTNAAKPQETEPKAVVEAPVEPKGQNPVPPDAATNDHAKMTVETETTKAMVQDDPRYAKYFKMLKMGVPENAVKQKMLVEGVDPSVLENPNAVSVVAVQAATKTVRRSKSSDSSFSDSSVSSFSD